MAAKDSVIYLSNVRLSFPHIAEPQRQISEATGKERISYNCEFLMPQDHAGFQQFMKLVAEMALDKWKEHSAQVLQMINGDRRVRCYGSGQEKINKKTMLPYDGYVGNVYITAGRDIQPQIIQPDGTAIDPANTLACQQVARKLYGGCRVNAAVKPWMQDNKYGRGIRCDFVAVQFAGDDTAFGDVAVDASEMFSHVTTAPPATTPGFLAAAMPGAPFPPGLPSFLS